MLDLARELSDNGFDVKFYSFVPKKRAMSFGLPGKCSASIFVPLSIFLALEKKDFSKIQMLSSVTSTNAGFYCYAYNAPM